MSPSLNQTCDAPTARI